MKCILVMNYIYALIALGLAIALLYFYKKVEADFPCYSDPPTAGKFNTIMLALGIVLCLEFLRAVLLFSKFKLGLCLQLNILALIGTFCAANAYRFSPEGAACAAFYLP